MNLHVKLRKKYREGLLKKWTWQVGKDYNSNSDCVLCYDFRDVDYRKSEMNCTRCPFNKFRKDDATGCENWIEQIEPEFDLCEPKEHEFARFIKKAKRYITFY